MPLPILHGDLHQRETIYELKVYGEVVLEHRIAVAPFPALGGKASFSAETVVPGGEARACIEFSQRGWKVAFGGVVGEDEAGREWFRQMSEAGVDLGEVKRAGRTKERWWFGDRGVEEG